MSSRTYLTIHCGFYGVYGEVSSEFQLRAYLCLCHQQEQPAFISVACQPPGRETPKPRVMFLRKGCGRGKGVTLGGETRLKSQRGWGLEEPNCLWISGPSRDTSFSLSLTQQTDWSTLQLCCCQEQSSWGLQGRGGDD